MRLPSLALAATAASFIAAATLAQPPAPPPPGAIVAEHAPVIQARRAGFTLQLAAFVQIKSALAHPDTDVKTLVLPARGIAAWGKAIPAMFPPGSAGGDALPTVWSDRPGFQALADALATDAAKLAELAKAGDTAGVQAQFALVGKDCGACHAKYRAEEKH